MTSIDLREVDLTDLITAQGGRRTPRPGYYYVSIRELAGPRHGLLAGPYVNDPVTALNAVDPTRRLAGPLNREQTAFAGFGVAWSPSDQGDGKLNRQLAEAHPELAPPSWKWFPAERPPIRGLGHHYPGEVGRGGRRERLCGHRHRIPARAEECAAQLAGRLNLERP